METTTKRVLVVDDDRMIRKLLRAALRKYVEVDDVDGGQAALDAIREKRYSVVLLDLMMPGVNGFDVIKELEPLLDAPPVIVVSAAAPAIIARAESRVVHAIVRKPFDLNELVAHVLDLCGLDPPVTRLQT